MRDRTVYKYSKALGKVVPIQEARMADYHAEEERTLANIKHGVINSEMEPTKHPIDGKYYTCKAKFRAVTRAHGCEEVGTAYENGYNPEREAEREFKNYIKEVQREWKERLAN